LTDTWGSWSQEVWIPAVHCDVADTRWQALTILKFLVFTDFCIYWIHRWLHHPWVYPTLHKTHHLWKVCTPWASHAFHPVDGFLQSVPYHIFVFVFPMNKVMYMGMFMLVNVWTISIHDGFFLSFEGLVNSSAHHANHHLYFSCNYGQYFTFWDRLFGTHLSVPLFLTPSCVAYVGGGSGDAWRQLPGPRGARPQAHRQGQQVAASPRLPRAVACSLAEGSPQGGCGRRAQLLRIPNSFQLIKPSHGTGPSSPSHAPALVLKAAGSPAAAAPALCSLTRAPPWRDGVMRGRAPPLPMPLMCRRCIYIYIYASVAAGVRVG